MPLVCKMGQGCEFDSIFYGGPLDGLEDTIVILDDDKAPKFVVRPTKDLTKKKLGEKVLDCLKKIRAKERVCVYKIEGATTEYSDDDVIPYHFLKCMTYSEFRIEYL